MHVWTLIRLKHHVLWIKSLPITTASSITTHQQWPNDSRWSHVHYLCRIWTTASARKEKKRKKSCKQKGTLCVILNNRTDIDNQTLMFNCYHLLARNLALFHLMPKGLSSIRMHESKASKEGIYNLKTDRGNLFVCRSSWISISPIIQALDHTSKK